ncbi:MAG: class I SAM-dependent methyltransferase, partial [Longimicrobiales bacterium]
MNGSFLISAAARYRDRSHERRADRFARLMRPVAGASVLDLGGGDGSFAARIARRCDVRVVVADVEETRHLAQQRHGFDAVGIPAETPLPFDDHAFDIVLCNSVIEHVTLPKEECLHARMAERQWRARAFERQRAFAAEIRRIGRGWFV